MIKTITDMKTETRRMRSWWTGAVLLWLAAAPLAQAFYNPSTGRWLNRDPIGEVVENNLYSFVRNQPISRLDYLGHLTIKRCDEMVANDQPTGNDTDFAGCPVPARE